MQLHGSNESAIAIISSQLTRNSVCTWLSQLARLGLKIATFLFPFFVHTPPVLLSDHPSRRESPQILCNKPTLHKDLIIAPSEDVISDVSNETMSADGLGLTILSPPLRQWVAPVRDPQRSQKRSSTASDTTSAITQ